MIQNSQFIQTLGEKGSLKGMLIDKRVQIDVRVRGGYSEMAYSALPVDRQMDMYRQCLSIPFHPLDYNSFNRVFDGHIDQIYFNDQIQIDRYDDEQPIKYIRLSIDHLNLYINRDNNQDSNSHKVDEQSHYEISIR